MDRAVFDSVEREIDDEVRARFPGDVIKPAVLLHYGGDPEIERLADPQAWELGEATHVPAHLGPAGLETVDTLIMAGIADRADAIRVVLPRFREQPEYEQLRERVREIDRLRAECLLRQAPDGDGPLGARGFPSAVKGSRRSFQTASRKASPGGGVLAR